MTIHIDDRAGSGDLVKLAPLKGASELCRLEFGDVMFTGHGAKGDVVIGIEVKSIWDMLSSISTGRLQGTQLPGMLDSYDISWMLIHGQYRAARNGQLQIIRKGQWKGFSIGARPVPYGYLESFLFDLAAMGVHVKHVDDMKQCAVWLWWLHRWFQKPWSQHKGMRTFDNSKKIVRTPGMSDVVLRRARVASALPGLGFERAVAAAKHFPSIEHMVSATVEEWMEVDGVGKTIAVAVVAAIREILIL